MDFKAIKFNKIQNKVATTLAYMSFKFQGVKQK